MICKTFHVPKTALNLHFVILTRTVLPLQYSHLPVVKAKSKVTAFSFNLLIYQYLWYIALYIEQFEFHSP